MNPTKPELSIVMPCLDEAATLADCIAKAQGFLREYGVDGEVVVADNGSRDGSPAIASAMGARLISVPEKGYGAALSGGIAEAAGKYVIMGDADGSYDFSAIMPMLERLRGGADMVVGDRFKGGIKRGAMPWMNRFIGNPALSWLGRLFFHVKLRDFHCGLRGFRRDALLSLDLRASGMEYASEMIVLAALNGLKIDEVPVTLWQDGRDRKPHLRPWRDGWRHLRFLLLHSPRWLYLYPSLAMIVFGLLIAALLLPGPVMIADGVGLDVHTLLIASMSVLVGVQGVTFGFIARSYAARHGIIPNGSGGSRYSRLFAEITLERLLLLAGGLVASGGIGVLFAAARWTEADFGALDYRDVMRILIVSVTAIVAGIQMGFAAFFVGVMRIKFKE